MSIKLINIAWEMDLPLGQKMVLMALADRSNVEGLCWPGQASLSRMCSMSERALRDNLKRLEEAGLLTIEHRRKDGEFRPAIYRLMIEKKTLPPADSADGTTGRSTHSPSADRDTHINQPSVNQPPIRTSAQTKQKTAVDILWDCVSSTFTGISEKQMAEWEEAFPGLDIDGELTRIELWYKTNPKKHKRDIRRFITSWLARAFKDSRVQKVFVSKPTAVRPP